MRIHWCLAVVLMGALAGCQPTKPEIAAVRPARPAEVDQAATLARQHAGDRDPLVRAHSVEALENTRGPATENILAAALLDSEPRVRYSAAMVIGKAKLTELKRTLVHLADNDADGSVRAAALYALQRLGDDMRTARLAELLESPEPSVRANTAYVLGRLGEPSAIALLRQHARHENDPTAKVRAIGAMAMLGDESAVQSLIAMSLSKFTDDKAFAYLTFADSIGKYSQSVLSAGLKDDQPENQLVAAYGLGRIGDQSGLKSVVAPHVNDKKPELRALAARALGTNLQPDQDWWQPLGVMLRDPDLNVQLAAAAAILDLQARSEAAATQPAK